MRLNTFGMQIFVLLAALIFLITPLSADSKKKAEKNKRPVLGWAEHVLLYPGPLDLQAKLDTGRTSSTVGVSNLQKFKKGNESWVRFTIQDRQGKELKLERKILRKHTIKGPTAERRSEYVVDLGLCLAGKYIEDELSLSERKEYSQEIRLGRQSLEGNFVIDPALTFTTQPECELPKPVEQ